MSPNAAPPAAAPRPIGLALPFAAIGLAGSTIVADVMFGPLSGMLPRPSSGALLPESLRIAAAIVIPVTGMCALLGRGVRQPIGKSLFLNCFLLTAAIAIAGAMAGAMAGGLAALFDMGSTSTPFWALVPGGGYLGLLLSAVFWAPLLLVFGVRWWTGQARPGSIFAGSERQRVWVATSFVIAIAAGFVAATLAWPHSSHEIFVAVVGTGALGLLLFAAVARLSKMLHVVRGLERIAEPSDIPADLETDLGIGDERWTSRVTSDAPYRGVRRTERSVLGAVFEVQRRLTRAVLARATLFGASLVLLLLTLAHRAEPAPLAVAAPPPPAPVPASPLPAAGVRWLSWYPLSPPILVDINGDGHEDIVGLRWNAGNEARALSLTATDGATLAPMWQGEPIACQWANPHVRLLRSGDRLFVTDSESLIHVYSLETGREIGAPLTMPENANLTCADPDGDANPRAWLWAYGGKSGPTDKGTKVAGYVLDATGIAPSPVEPKWCARTASHPACTKGPRAPGTCEAYHDYRTPSIAPKLMERYSLEDGDVAVAIGFRRQGDAWSQTDTIIGYDPATRKVRWDQPVARWFEEHAFPRVQVDLSGGKVFTLYQEKSGSWELAARDAKTGEAAWATEPPRALEGTNFDSLTITRQGVYLGLSNRLEVFDPGTGQSRGVVW